MLWHTYIFLLVKQQKSRWSSKFDTNKEYFLRKEMIFRKKFPLTPGLQLWQTWKFFWIKTPVFLAQIPKKFETMSKTSINVFTKNLPRPRRLQLWQLWWTFPLKVTKNSSLRALKIWWVFPSWERIFLKLFLGTFYFSFGNREENCSSLSKNLHYSSKKPETFNTFFQKQYSVSAPLDILNLVLTPQSFLFQ